MMHKIVSFFFNTSTLTEKKKAIFIIILSIINSLLTLGFLVAIYSLINFILGNSNTIESKILRLIPNNISSEKTLILLCILFLFVSIVSQLFYNFYSNKWIVGYINRIEKNIFKATLKKDYSFIKSKKSYDYSKLLIDHLPKMSLGIFSPVLNIITQSVIFLIYIIFLLQINFSVTVIGFLVISILSITIYFFVRKYLIKLSILENDSLRNRIKYLNNSISLFRDLKIYSFKDFFIKSFFVHSDAYFKARYIVYFLSNILKFIFEFLIFFSILMLTYSLVLNTSGENYSNLVSLLSIYILVMYKLIPICILILNSFASISSNIKFFDIVRNEYDTLDHHIQVTDTLKNKNYKINSLFLDSISYNYENKEVLKNLSLNLDIGSNLILTGATGSGKSTLLDIISGIIKPSSGSIYLNKNTKVNFENNFFLRKRISYSSQNTEIFDDNIYNNITLNFEKKNSKEEIAKDIKFIKIIKLSFVENLLHKKNLSYTENFYERGQNLSGGEKQRIGIARALYHDSDIMLFDESTSAIDSILEEKIIKNIINFSENKILILCSHNLNLTKFFKNHLNLEDHNNSIDI
jgi:ABC-type multidrug transport system fused ATPase/permease subunit